MGTSRIVHTFIALRRQPSPQAKSRNQKRERPDRFETLEGALACLIEDFNLAGLSAERDKLRLL